MKTQAKRPTVRKLFVERMKREGRDKEWYSTIKQVMRETGQKYAQASWEAMRRMGYKGPEKERQLHDEFLKAGEKTKLQRQIDAEREAIKEEQRIEDFEKAFRMLPNKAPSSVELDWIRAHPAMTRWVQQKDRSKIIVITPEDILNAPHGRAPSKAAGSALHHWANNPNHFFKEIISEQIKHTEDGKVTKVDEDMGLDEVRRILMQVKSRNGGTCSAV